MKIIELLQKIANGEEVKFKVLQSGEEYYIKKGKFLHNELGEEVNWYIDEEWLNLEVEIIEEDKKIEKLESYISCGWYGTCKDLKREELFESLKKIGNKINEIIDYINNKD